MADEVADILFPTPKRRSIAQNGATPRAVTDLGEARAARKPALELAPGEPTVSFPGEEAITVTIPTALGEMVFEADQIQLSPRSLDTLLTMRLSGPGGTAYPPFGRHNLLSSSAKESIRKELDAAYGRAEWGSVINTACYLIMQRHVNRDLSQRVDLIERTHDQAVAHLIDGVLLDGAPNIIFGSGEAGKGLLTMSWALMVAGGDVGGRCAERLGGVLYVDYEDDAGEFSRRWDGLLKGAGYFGGGLPVYRWPARHVALADQIDAIRRKVEREGIIFVIIDSAAPACGDKPEEAENTSRYFSAIASLGPGVTTATIAHQTKGARELRDQSSPFGSTFWRDRARRLWSSRLAEQNDPTVLDVTLVCRKNNRGRRPPPFGARITFSDVERGGDGSINVEWRDPRQERDATLTEDLPMRDRIWAALATPMLVEEIVIALGLESRQSSTVRNTLNKWRGKLFGKGGTGEKWGRIEREEHAG